MPKPPAERTTPRIRVSSPCPMRWESLIPVAGGRHCDACRKTVIDVERLTSAEVEALVESGEPACVRVATLPDGSVLTRDHPRAPRRAAAWAGAAIAVSALACSERVAEKDVAACPDREARESPRSAVARDERTAVDRPVEAEPTARVEDDTPAITVGGLGFETDGGFEAPPPLPDFDLTTPVTGPGGMSGEETYMLGGIGESGPLIDEMTLPPFGVELD